MPDDGLELIREVKAATVDRRMHVPAIAITAFGERSQELLNEGFVELVPKPLDPLELCD